MRPLCDCYVMPWTLSLNSRSAYKTSGWKPVVRRHHSFLPTTTAAASKKSAMMKGPRVEGTGLPMLHTVCKTDCYIQKQYVCWLMTSSSKSILNSDDNAFLMRMIMSFLFLLAKIPFHTVDTPVKSRTKLSQYRIIVGLSLSSICAALPNHIRLLLFSR